MIDRFPLVYFAKHYKIYHGQIQILKGLSPMHIYKSYVKQPSLIIAILICLNLSCGAKTTIDQQRALINQEIPDQKKPLLPHFLMHSLKNLSINTQWFEGKTLLIHYFTTWCHPCVDQVTILNQVQLYYQEKKQALDWTEIKHITQKLESFNPKKNKLDIPIKEALSLEIEQIIKTSQSDVVIIGICLEKKGCRRLIDFQEINQINYGLWVGDSVQRAGNGPFGKITALPVSYLIDKKGHLQGYYEGMMTTPYLIEEINKIR